MGPDNVTLNLDGVLFLRVVDPYMVRPLRSPPPLYSSERAH